MSLNVDLTPLWTPAEHRKLLTLRERFRDGADRLTDRELARLKFLRWIKSREHAPRD